MSKHSAHVVRGIGVGLLLAHGGDGDIDGDIARARTAIRPD
ncbi:MULTISPECIES: hypothetical protein [unclassified Streptosporangium]|nr:MULTISPECIES: hypothetical protein [unclassified Streptosporangium]